MTTPCPRHLLAVTDLGPTELLHVLLLANRADLPQVLAGRGVGLIFEKPSNRTRQSTEVAVVQLGGHPVYTRGDEIGFDVRETVEDITRVMAGYHSVLAARVFDHRVVERMAAASVVPVINLLSDYEHPLQAITDVLTMQHAHGPLAGRTVAYVGDYNNVARSLAEACIMLGANVSLGCPIGYAADDAELERLGGVGRGSVRQTHRALSAVVGAIAVHTDTWTSMGQESEQDARRRAFESFRVTPEVMAAAEPGAGFYHCLPAHRGLEVDAAVIDGEQSHVFTQAHNRLHAARAALAFVMGVR